MTTNFPQKVPLARLPHPPAHIPRLALTVEESAESIAISPRLLTDLAVNKIIPSFRLGRRRLFAVDVLRDWVNEQAAHGRSIGGDPAAEDEGQPTP